MSGLYPSTESRRAAKIDVAAQTCAHLSDVAIACGKRSSNGPDQNNFAIQRNIINMEV